MRLVFCGTPASAVPSLHAIANRPDWDVVAVLSQPDRPAGRGRQAQASPVKTAALERGLDVMTPARLKDARQTLQELAPDVVAVVAYGHIFRRWLLELPPLGCINLHFSLLPRHRGVAPVTWAILEGDRETGVTTMRMDRGIDTGDVLLMERTPITATDTTATLTEKLAESGGALLVQTLEQLQRGILAPTPQTEEGATYARRLEKSDGLLDWELPAEVLARQVRGLHPWPGTYTHFRGRLLKVHEVQATAAADPSRPAGEFCEVDERVLVASGAGALELRRVQAEGKATTEAAAWARGARPQVGEALTSDR